MSRNPIEATTERLYTRQFFQMFTAVALFMTGMALQFHFGQYVEYLGHGVDTLGRILSISMVGTLLIRLHIGRWIDRFGCRPTWIVGTLIVAVTVGAIQFTRDLWLIVVLRTVSTMATAAVMTTIAVFAALMAPRQRRAESIGIMGLAGFIGLIIGPTLGDWIFSGSTVSVMPYHLFFSASAACSVLAGSAMVLMSMPIRHGPEPARIGAGRGGCGSPESSSAPVSQLRIITKHWPGMILLIGLVFTMAFCWQSLFLERLAEDRGFRDIKWFFLIYGPTAIILRIICRRVPERIGRTRTLIAGLCLLACGQLCMIGIQSQWGLVVPGFLMGAGHCFIFPSMVDLGADRLPLAQRGTGTALILGAGDLGMLIGFVALGEVIDAFGFDITLIALAVTVLASAGLFAVARRKAIFST